METSPEESGCALDWIDDLWSEDPEEAWERFVRRYRFWVWSRIKKQCRGYGLDWSPSEAEEWLQEVWCRLLEDRCRRLRAFEGKNEETFRAFLAKVVRSVVADFARRVRAVKRKGRVGEYLPRMGRREDPLDQLPDHRTCPERWVRNRQYRRKLLSQWRSAAGRSGERNVQILRLAILEGWTSPEIAAALKLTVSAVDSAVSRCRARLRSRGVSLPSRL